MPLNTLKYLYLNQFRGAAGVFLMEGSSAGLLEPKGADQLAWHDLRSE